MRLPQTGVIVSYLSYPLKKLLFVTGCEVIFFVKSQLTDHSLLLSCGRSFLVFLAFLSATPSSCPCAFVSQRRPRLQLTAKQSSSAESPRVQSAFALVEYVLVKVLIVVGDWSIRLSIVRLSVSLFPSAKSMVCKDSLLSSYVALKLSQGWTNSYYIEHLLPSFYWFARKGGLLLQEITIRLLPHWPERSTHWRWSLFTGL